MAKIKQGLFISVEGMDGAGKSTLCTSLHQHYSAIYPGMYVPTREPGGNGLFFCEKIRELVLSDASIAIAPKTEAVLFAASRAEHVEKLIRPELNAGKIVLSDRYVDSSIAYQGAARGLGAEWVKTLNLSVTDGLMPDLTLLLCLDEGSAGRRSGMRGQDQFNHLDRLSADFHKRVGEQFMLSARQEPRRIHIISAENDPGTVLKDAIARIDKLIKERSWNSG